MHILYFFKLFSVLYGTENYKENSLLNFFNVANYTSSKTIDLYKKKLDITYNML